MPLKMIPSRARESSAQGRFRALLDTAIASASTTGGRVDPVALEGMLSMVRSKEISPGDALSCFKNHFREGPPDTQLTTLKILVQFVDTDPHLANLLHVELASRRWRERFVVLAASPHPEVRPLLISTLSGWAASYRAHDIGMHYQTTLKELNGADGTFRSGYNPQHTGYSAQATGYTTQATGAGYPGGPAPPAGYPMPPPGYPHYGGMGGVPYPPPIMPHQPPPPRNDAATLSSKVDQLASEMEVLRGATETFEVALADYKAQRAPFATLSAAMERGQRAADRCTSLQSQLENLLGTSDAAGEALMGRVFTTNDSAMTLLEQWKRVANQELAPDDTPAASNAGPGPSAAAASAAGAGTSTSTAAAPSPPQPAPSPLDLLLGDDLLTPTPPLPAAVAADPAANGSAAWPAAAHGADSAAAAAAAGGAFFGASGAAAAVAGVAVAAHPVAPAADVEGLRAQVLALSTELENLRKMHKTQMETQEAFHRSEMAQVKAQFQARIFELETALSRQQLQQQTSVGAPSPLSGVGSLGGAPAAAPAPLYSAASGSAAAPPLLPPPTGGLASSNPFAPLASTTPAYGTAAPAPAAGPFAAAPTSSLTSPTGASGAGGAGALDFFAGLSAPAPAQAAGGPVTAGSARLPLPPDLFSEPGVGAGAQALVASAKPFGSLPAPAAPAVVPAAASKPAAGGGSSWVDFGL